MACAIPGPSTAGKLACDWSCRVLASDVRCQIMTSCILLASQFCMCLSMPLHPCNSQAQAGLLESFTPQVSHARLSVQPFLAIKTACLSSRFPSGSVHAQPVSNYWGQPASWPCVTPDNSLVTSLQRP